MAWRSLGVGVTGMLLLGLCCWSSGLRCWSSTARGEESRFAMTHSRSQYVHWIDLYDAEGARIDPTAPDAAPYSPVHTCGRCHDYDAITHGHHFNAMAKLANPGRPGEPWIWTDTRTGTQIPLSYRGWPGTYDPRNLGISAWDFTLKFGRQMPGGGPGAPSTESSADDEQDDDADESDPTEEISARDQESAEQQPAQDDAQQRVIGTPVDNGRWQLAGELPIDCMMCHARQRAYSPETWWEQISKQNFAWAPSAALGIADIDGDVSKLKDPPPKSESTDAKEEDGQETDSKEDEPKEDGPQEDDATDADAAKPTGPVLPKTTYRPVRINAQKKIFFDVTRKPSNDVCYYCHTTRVARTGAVPDWTHDEDVHLRAGMLCTDCHRNGIAHHTVRGFEGEEHARGLSVVTLSCRGCHLGEETETGHVTGGRLGAPKPLHKGLPPLHLERLSCTTCHSGPRPTEQALQVQTAMAHALGLPTHHLDVSTEPAMVAPVMLRTDGVLYPHRMVWPAFWGEIKGEQITPLHPNAVQDTLRRKLRVRRNATFTETLGKVTLKSADKVSLLGEDRAKVPINELAPDEKAKLDELKATKAVEGFREKLSAALKELKKLIKTEGAEPVYVAGGRVYRLGADDKVEVFANKATEPYAWRLAHDVRPARWSSGATNCFECHTLGAPIFDGKVTALGPAIDPDPPTEQMAELAGFDRTQIDAWNLSFKGRTAFKWFGFVSAGVVAVILLSFVFLGVNGVFGLFRRS